MESWDTLREVLELIGEDKTPVIESIHLDHEVYEQRDGVGAVVDTQVVLKGASVNVGFLSASHSLDMAGWREDADSRAQIWTEEDD